MNSLVGNPEAETAATKADGPGMGVTSMFLSVHNLACIKITNIEKKRLVIGCSRRHKHLLHLAKVSSLKQTYLLHMKNYTIFTD